MHRIHLLHSSFRHSTAGNMVENTALVIIKKVDKELTGFVLNIKTKKRVKKTMYADAFVLEDIKVLSFIYKTTLLTTLMF